MDAKEHFLQAQGRYFDLFSTVREASEHSRIEMFDVPQPDVIAGPWLPFHCFAEDYTRGLRNAVEQFGADILRLGAWGEILQDHPENMRPWLLEECILPLASNTLVTPFIVKERFNYCVCMLFHYSAHLVDPTAKRVINQKRIRKESLDKAKRIGSLLNVDLTAFRDELGLINNGSLDEIRNQITHRFPPNVEYGNSTILVRHESGNHVAFGFGGEPPIKIAEIIPLLWNEHERCVRTFHEFHRTIYELVAAWERLSKS